MDSMKVRFKRLAVVWLNILGIQHYLENKGNYFKTKVSKNVQLMIFYDLSFFRKEAPLTSQFTSHVCDLCGTPTISSKPLTAIDDTCPLNQLV